MDTLTKILGVGCLTGCLLGFLSLFTSSPNRPNLYAEAEYLRSNGEYREAIAKYEQILKERQRPPVEAKVIDANFPTLFKYRIAICYAQWAEQEGKVSLYAKAEEAVRESYSTAIIPTYQAGILYLWGYILFKQARYEEACAKFQGLIGTFPQSLLVENAWYFLGKVHLELGDEEAARQTFQQLLDHFPDSEYKDEVGRLLGK